MITEKTYSKEWLLELKESLGSKKRHPDPGLIEKATKALHLLEELCKSDINFVFKGGTSLLLLLDEMHRLSIDIDIVVENDNQDSEIHEILNNIATESPVFIRVEEDVRNSNSHLRKSHFKFYYYSDIVSAEVYVLLDILYETNHYPEINSTKIDCRLIDFYEPALYSATPSVNCILGDKMTAYAPNTTGIPYNKNKELEIIKQLFDVANLFDKFDDINIVKTTFQNIANQELKYRNLADTHDYMDVLDDIFNTSLIISLRGKLESEIYQLLSGGIRSLKNFVLTSNFTIDSAIKCSSKAAYLAMLLKYDIHDFVKYNHGINLNNYYIETPEYLGLNKIKKTAPEAFFYWYKCIELLV